MIPWNALLQRLAEAPRDNGTAALHQAAAFLRQTLEGVGLEAELVAFTAQPYRLRLAGVIALAGGLLYARALLAGRNALALAVAVLLPTLLLAQLEFGVPVFGWIGAQTQHHVRARRPVEAPSRRLLLTAHYDTKTDVLDHVERAPIDRLAVPVALLMVLAPAAGALAARSRKRGRFVAGIAGFAAGVAALYGLGMFIALSAGAFVPKRSPGALDDGGACAVLVRLAEVLTAMPAPERTQVEILLLSAEEVGVQGSEALAAHSFAAPPALPTFVVNLEGLGASPDHAVLARERFTLRSLAPDARLVALLDAVHRELFEKPLPMTPYGGATDARSFLARGIPAATLLSLEPGERFPRGLHSARDDRSRLDEDSLEASVAYLLAIVKAVDEREL
ncbi:MAG: M28 family metallopeptidase [Myxococcales bacterium]|nr:M28 family metallopeptidase [Myxococcales bacterium]